MTPLACLAALTLAAAPLVGTPGESPYRDPKLRDRDHWAFVAPVRPSAPPAKWGSNPVDAFVFQQLEAAKLAPSPEADRLTLLRRVTLDLTGLPPTPADAARFLADPSPDAYERLVDRLLASPHFGERWAQHWLDVVRFAESNGYEADGDRPDAWRYRDYVVSSFNADKPYDQFLKEQLAGDPSSAATGFYRCGPVHVVAGNVDREALRNEFLTEIVDNVGSALLGLTVGCARCHDHKFDPVSLGDYYRLQAVFAPTFPHDSALATDAEEAAYRAKLDPIIARLRPIQKAVQQLEAPYRARLAARKAAKLDAATRAALAVEPVKRSAEQKKLVSAAGPALAVHWDEIAAELGMRDRLVRTALKAIERDLTGQKPDPLPRAWGVADIKSPGATYVLRRGEIKRQSSVAMPAAPRLFEPPPVGNRRELAAWVVGTNNPLTARVIVNRLWQHHFARGLVGTPNDFGTRGDEPTHPELLDWLACELVTPSDPKAVPWSLKRLHRLMVTSATYRQAGRTRNAAALAADPHNRLLWRMPTRRLDAESVRDAVLSAAGTLNPAVGGPGVRLPLEPEVAELLFTEDDPAGLWRVTPDPRQHDRRTLYLFRKRNLRLPLLEAYDQPDTLGSCALRPSSTYAPQALILMNGPFARGQAARLAAHVEAVAGAESAAQVRQLYWRTLSRPSRPEEEQTATAFLAAQAALLKSQGHADPRRQALADLCLALFNVNEFVTAP